MMCRTIVAGLMVSLLLAISVRAADDPKPPVSTLVLPAAKAAIPEAKHFITKWALLAPFVFSEDDFGGFPQTASVNKEFMPKEGELNGTQAPPAGSKAKWEVKTFNDPDVPGKIDLGDLEHVATYAVATLDCPEAITDAKLMVGSDDYIKVWINGKLVHTYNTNYRAGDADQDRIPGSASRRERT